MTNSYELVFLMTPVLSDSDVKKTISNYTSFIKDNGAEIVDEEFWGLKQIAYPIKKKSTAIYHVVEFRGPTDIISKLELSLHRDENILRFLTVRLDKYGQEYNADRRAGKKGNRSKVKQEL